MATSTPPSPLYDHDGRGMHAHFQYPYSISQPYSASPASYHESAGSYFYTGADGPSANSLEHAHDSSAVRLACNQVGASPALLSRLASKSASGRFQHPTSSTETPQALASSLTLVNTSPRRAMDTGRRALEARRRILLPYSPCPRSTSPEKSLRRRRMTRAGPSTTRRTRLTTHASWTTAAAESRRPTRVTRPSQATNTAVALDILEA